MKVEILPMAIKSQPVDEKFLQKGLCPGSRDPFYETRKRAEPQIVQTKAASVNLTFSKSRSTRKFLTG